MKMASLVCVRHLLIAGIMATLLFSCVPSASARTENYDYNDSHFHLTNNIQEGPEHPRFVDHDGLTHFIGN